MLVTVSENDIVLVEWPVACWPQTEPVPSREVVEEPEAEPDDDWDEDDDFDSEPLPLDEPFEDEGEKVAIPVDWPLPAFV